MSGLEQEEMSIYTSSRLFLLYTLIVTLLGRECVKIYKALLLFTYYILLHATGAFLKGYHYTQYFALFP